MNKVQSVSNPQGLALVQPQAELEQPTLIQLFIRIEVFLKPERVQEPQALSADAADAEGLGGFALELAVSQSQPVTIELGEPKVTFTFHTKQAAV